MNGIHDMGGMHGFGPIPIEVDEPCFHQPWEGRVLAGNLALSPHFGTNVDRFRFLIEIMDPADYLASSYYERWLASILASCLEHGLLNESELALINRGEVPTAEQPAGWALPAKAIRGLVIGGEPARHDHWGESIFSVGQAVRARNLNPGGHTRLARYVRGKAGVVVSDNGRQLLPDDHAAGRGETLQRLYTVKFKAQDLWGENVNPRDSLCIDLWESYLEQQ
jgi:nitrile hydratase beta subunit